MLNSLLVFCKVNYFRMIGLLVTLLAILIILYLIHHSAFKRKKKGTIVFINFVGSFIYLLFKVSYLIWLLMTVLVIASKTLVF